MSIHLRATFTRGGRFEPILNCFKNWLIPYDVSNTIEILLNPSHTSSLWLQKKISQNLDNGTVKTKSRTLSGQATY